MYAIEQNWGLYYDRMIDQHATMQSVLYCLFDSYADSKDFMEFQKEWFPFSHSRFKQTTADMHKLDLDCSELFDIVKSKKSYDTSPQIIDEVLRSDQKDYWIYFMKTKRYSILFSAMQFFFGYRYFPIDIIYLFRSQFLHILFTYYREYAVHFSYSRTDENLFVSFCVIAVGTMFAA